MTDAGFNKPPDQIDWDLVVFVLVSIAIVWFLLWHPHTNPNRIGGHDASRISATV